MTHHGEKIKTKQDKEGKLNIYSIENLLNVNNISLEIRSLHRSIALMKQDLLKILRD